MVFRVDLFSFLTFLASSFSFNHWNIAEDPCHKIPMCLENPFPFILLLTGAMGHHTRGPSHFVFMG